MLVLSSEIGINGFYSTHLLNKWHNIFNIQVELSDYHNTIHIIDLHYFKCFTRQSLWMCPDLLRSTLLWWIHISRSILKIFRRKSSHYVHERTRRKGMKLKGNMYYTNTNPKAGHCHQIGLQKFVPKNWAELACVHKFLGLCGSKWFYTKGLGQLIGFDLHAGEISRGTKS